MAGIIQVDPHAPYKRLIRKIGFSVGLENLIERVKQLTDLYVGQRGISAGDFAHLVADTFGRPTAVNHFADFYSQLNLIRSLGRNIEPLYQLDSLAILRQLLVDHEAEYDMAVRVVLTQSVIEEDGDVFLNALKARFKPRTLRELLEAMLRAKRRAVAADLRTPHLLNRILDAVDIKSQSGDAAQQKGEAAPHGRFARRRERLDTSRRTTPLSPPELIDKIAITDDYLEKVCQTRKGWAIDLGFYRGDDVTQQGLALLSNLATGVASQEPRHGALLFWGYTAEVDRLKVQLRVTLPGAVTSTSWELLDAVASALLEGSPARLDPPDTEAVIRHLRNFYALYKDTNASKGLIRNSLPLYIAEPVLAAVCTAAGQRLPNLPEILAAEYSRQPTKRIQLMNIRGTSGALFFMS